MSRASLSSGSTGPPTPAADRDRARRPTPLRGRAPSPRCLPPPGRPLRCRARRLAGLHRPSTHHQCVPRGSPGSCRPHSPRRAATSSRLGAPPAGASAPEGRAPSPSAPVAGGHFSNTVPLLSSCSEAAPSEDASQAAGHDARTWSSVFSYSRDRQRVDSPRDIGPFDVMDLPCKGTRGSSSRPAATIPRPRTTPPPTRRRRPTRPSRLTRPPPWATP